MIHTASPLDFGFSSATRIIPLRGFSGCHVVLAEDGGGSYVRKLAVNIEYNARLLQQAAKQKAFDGGAVYHAVKIRATGCLPSGLAYIDMDYVPGVTAAEMLASLPLADIQRWTSKLMKFSEAKEDGFLPASVFYDKIDSLTASLSSQGLVGPPVSQTLDVLRRRPWTQIPASTCHGDLTLENMIVHEGRLYLIDFLDSFADSWYIDMAKLLQDLVGGWSFRHNPIDRNFALRIASLRHNLETALEVLYPGCLSFIRDLYALNLLRILPYSSSPEDRAFIEDRLAAALNDFL